MLITHWKVENCRQELSGPCVSHRWLTIIILDISLQSSFVAARILKSMLTVENHRLFTFSLHSQCAVLLLLLLALSDGGRLNNYCHLLVVNIAHRNVICYTLGKRMRDEDMSTWISHCTKVSSITNDVIYSGLERSHSTLASDQIKYDNLALINQMIIIVITGFWLSRPESVIVWSVI